jgi:hypothetical protein
VVEHLSTTEPEILLKPLSKSIDSVRFLATSSLGIAENIPLYQVQQLLYANQSANQSVNQDANQSN